MRPFLILGLTLLLLGCRDENREAADRFRQSDAGLAAADRANRIQLTEMADRVRIADSAGVRGCEFVKRLQVSQTDVQLDGHGASTQTLLQSRAAKLRANAIVLIVPPQYEGRITIGDAYRCGR